MSLILNQAAEENISNKLMQLKSVTKIIIEYSISPGHRDDDLSGVAFLIEERLGSILDDLENLPEIDEVKP